MRLIFLFAISYFVFIGSWAACLFAVGCAILFFYFNKIKYWLWAAAFIVTLLVSTVMVDAYISYSKKQEASARGEIPSQQAQELVNLGWKNMLARPPEYGLAMYNNQAGYKLNHPEAAANIGLLFEYGWGVKKDTASAARWYQKAIAMGSFRSAQADYQLAGLYEKGLAGEIDLPKARSHYSEALRISTNSVFDIYHDETIATLSSDALNRLNGYQ